MKRIINFSGGRTSAMMTILEYQPNDIVIFCDTGREHELTYQFINDFEKHENIPIVRLKYDGGFDGMLEKRKQIPNQFKRFCTLELKIRTARRYIRSIGIMQYQNLIGFRYDEEIRVKRQKQHWKKVENKYPLFDRKIDKQQVNEFWNNKSYNLNMPSILGNCTLCFMKGKNAIMNILASYPELADAWIDDETKYGHTYLNGISMKQMKMIAQNNLFKNQNLEHVNPAYTCACTT